MRSISEEYWTHFEEKKKADGIQVEYCTVQDSKTN